MLISITAYARAGALEHAWRLFREAGLEGLDDAAALSLKGRLLKDRARAAEGSARQVLYLEAAEAYGRAAALSGQTYPRINAATLFLLAGQDASARSEAEAVLASLAAQTNETPYWLEATRAEALLVLGRTGDAKAALSEAVALAPRAWEDHASTLRQFGLILAAQGEDAGWLEPLRPPRAVHFAGHMALGAREPAVAGEVAAALARERAGFGYGALAAGADIVIAEALLAHGADLHLVLPAGAAAFREASVARFGADWAERFDRLIAEAASVRAIPGAPEPAHPLAVQLASEVAMGQAVMQAQTLATEALQLVVLDDEDGASGSSGWARAAWAASGRRQDVIVAARAGAAAGKAKAKDAVRLAALLAVAAETPAALKALRAVTGEGRWAAGVLHLAFATPVEAAAAARRIAQEIGSAVGGDYGLVEAVSDGGAELLLGGPAQVAPAILAAAPPGAAHLSETFAAALHAGAADVRTEYVGTLPWRDDEIALHALRP